MTRKNRRVALVLADTLRDCRVLVDDIELRLRRFSLQTDDARHSLLLAIEIPIDEVEILLDQTEIPFQFDEVCEASLDRLIDNLSPSQRNTYRIAWNEAMKERHLRSLGDLVEPAKSIGTITAFEDVNELISEDGE